MPLWLNSFGQNFGAYFVFSFSSLLYVIFFLAFVLLAPFVRNLLFSKAKLGGAPSQENNNDNATSGIINDGRGEDQSPPPSPSTPLLNSPSPSQSLDLNDSSGYLSSPTLLSFLRHATKSKEMIAMTLFLFVIIGFFDAANGIFSVYSSPPTRTPPLFQTFFANVRALPSLFFFFFFGNSPRHLF